MVDVQVFQPPRLLSTHAIADLLAAIGHSLIAGRSTIVVDLSQVRFMDSCGLAGLITAYKRVQAAKGAFAVCGAWGQPQMLLELTGTQAFLTMYGSVSDFYAAANPGHSGSEGTDSGGPQPFWQKYLA